MSYIPGIATAVPEYRIEKEDMVRFYSNALSPGETNRFTQRLNFLNKKTKIKARYSCIYTDLHAIQD